MRSIANIAVVALVLLAAIAVRGPARAQGDDPRSQALAGAIAGTPEGLAALQHYLDGAGLPNAVAASAVDLIATLPASPAGGDPVALQDAADRISEAATVAADSAPIVRLSVDPALALGQGRYGFDFGPADGAVQPGFRRVDARSNFVRGADMNGLRRPEGDSLLGDGVRGVEQFITRLPNGTYRVLLMTDDIGINEVTTNPYGQSVTVNGQDQRIAGVTPDQWLPSARLGAGADPAAAGADTGGVIVLTAVVTNGRLRLAFNGEAVDTYLTGIIIEPVTEPSVLDDSGPASGLLEERENQILEAEDRVQEQLGELLSQVATAAGPDQLADILNLDQAVQEPAQDVSPN